MTRFPVIGIVGKQASGKTVAASELSDDDTARVRMGDVVWDEIKERDMEVNEENAGKVANQLREEEGMDAIAKHCVPIINKKLNEGKTVIVDGIRGLSEVKRFKKDFGEDFYLISIEASEETRYNRIKDRKRDDDIKNLEEFKEKEKREIGWGLEEAIDSADYKISNEGTEEDFRKKISRLFEEIMSNYEN